MVRLEDKFLGMVKSVLETSNVVLYVGDARFPRISLARPVIDYGRTLLRVSLHTPFALMRVHTQTYTRHTCTHTHTHALYREQTHCGRIWQFENIRSSWWCLINAI